ncbi:lysozyme C II-like [Triplophysa dalaica]|uniref:lysozyme C II-like n=1 Tax=Triplophysa dalaica TaxID=1582913 RepID=UPI0024DF9F84|nr:lysozyme C II-like [Triplophysa dalaica]
MKVIVFLLVILAADAKKYERCELAKALNARGMSGYADGSLGDWVCLIRSESSYNTAAKNHNKNGSKDYGIFQINSNYWCHDDDKPGRSNDCNINCSQLLNDDISLSVKCAKIIAKRHGLNAWYGWKNHCKDKDVRQYIKGCGL